VRILSLAPHFRLTAAVAGYSHYIPFQRSLRDAASALGHELAIVTRVGAGGPEPLSDGILDVLPAWPKGHKFAFDWQPARDALDRLLAQECDRLPAGEPLIVLRYEGRLQEYAAVADLVRRHPRARFIWNLYALSGLAVPGSPPRGRQRSGARFPSWRTSTPQPASPAFKGVAQPDNLLIVGDEWTKHAFAQALGMRSRGVWPLSSSIARAPDGILPQVPTWDPGRSDRAEVGRARILIPQADWQFDDEIRSEIGHAVRALTRSASTTAPIFTVAGHQGSDRTHLRWLSRLERLGVTVRREALSPDDCSRTISEHDLVWLPNGQLYREKSSGKVLDVLTLGVPLLAPAGSQQALQFRRWVPWGLDYTCDSELLRILENLDFFLPPARSELHRRLVDVQTDTAPKTAIERLIELASG
jgi:hypothetical protein